MSLGTDRVRLDFNPNGDPEVSQLKVRFADLIDYVDGLPRLTDETPKGQEQRRLIALALTHVEDACMWAVKAATT